MIARRRRGGAALIYKLCSLFLQYPDPELMDARHDLAAEAEQLPETRATRPLRRFCAWWAHEDPLALEQHYVETFDLERRCGLYLTFYTEGDKRQRGAALLRLKRIYRAAGLPIATGELPDFLPAMLEFAAAATPSGQGTVVLHERRPAIELLRASLHDRDTPYALVLDAICGALGTPSSAARTEADALAADGPPVELVGLEPFAPVDIPPSGARR